LGGSGKAEKRMKERRFADDTEIASIVLAVEEKNEV
jgi:hypothetical protein